MGSAQLGDLSDHAVADALSIKRAAREAPDHPAVVSDKGAWSFVQMNHKAAGIARWLVEREFEPKGAASHLAFVADGTVEAVALIYAALQLGITLVPLHPRLTASERDERVRALGTPRIVDIEALRQCPATSEWPTIDGAPATAIAAVVPTSGTTGSPNGVMLSRRAWVASARASAANLGWDRHDRWLLCMPLAHVGGWSIVTRCLAACKTVVLHAASFRAAEVERVVTQHRVTLMSVVPTMLRRMLDDGLCPGAYAGVRAVLVGGAPCDAELLSRAHQAGIAALGTYGLTESCAQVITQPYGQAPSGGAGVVLPGVSVRARDGELQLRGPMLMSGYVPSTEEPWTPDGWMRTHDLAELRADGTVLILGRLDDCIITGGENVYPQEVEAVLESLEGVQEACVFGVPDAQWGQHVAAAVMLGGPASSIAEVADAARRKLAPYKLPRRWAVVDALDRTPSGKLQRKRVANNAIDKLVKA